MHCFYVEKDQIGSEQAIIRGSDVNHIQRVLRMQESDQVTVCDGDGAFFECLIEEFAPEEIRLSIQKRLVVSAELPVKLYLFQALPKKDKMEFIIQKAVELGVHAIVPMASRYCIAKLDNPKKEEKKLERWQAISEAAAKQSGRGRIPKVYPAVRFLEAVDMAKEKDFAFIPYECAKGSGDGVRSLKKAALSSSVGIMIGPEGGFSKEEIAAAKAAGILPISLGNRILRTETAGLAALSYLMLEAEAQQDK